MGRIGGITTEKREELISTAKKIAIAPIRIGFGEDSHYVHPREVIGRRENKVLRLGGVLVDDCYSPDSNSDGDAVIHAAFNAFASAFGLMPVGYYFEGEMESSRPILDAAVEMLNNTPYVVMNMVIAIEGKRPRIVPLIPLIQNNFSEAFKVEPNQIGITATSGEELSEYGKGRGIHVAVQVCLMHERINELLSYVIDVDIVGMSEFLEVR